MRDMSQTSILNYRTLVQPKLTEREKWVLEAIEELAPCSNEQVAEYLGVPVNVTSGRFTGLRNKKHIEKVRRGFNKQGRMVDYYRPVREDKEYGDAY